MKLTAKDYQRLRYTLDAFTDLSMQAVEAREFASAARSILYLLLGSVGVPRGLLLGCDAAGRLYPLSAKGSRGPALVESLQQSLLHASRSELGELARLPQLLSAGDRRLPARLRDFLATGGFAQAMPLVVRGRLAGVLALGRRVNGALLGAEESGSLETLTRYAAVLLHQHELMQQLRGAVDENLRLCETLADTYFDTVRAFSAAIDAKDVYTRGHSVRVARYSAGLAQRAGLPARTIAGIRIGAYLHDIGKIVLDRSLLNKTGRLTEEERREMISHPAVGDEVLSSVRFPWPEVRAVVRHHHERLDGQGYPDGLSGERIPVPARVLAIADAFDAMTSNRPYRERMPVEGALGELVRCSGVQFDPALVHAFLDQCRSEVAPPDARGGAGKSSNGKKVKVRMFGGLLDRASYAPTVSFIDSLLQALGPVPRLQPA